jgi:hypothetical protein
MEWLAMLANQPQDDDTVEVQAVMRKKHTKESE